VIEHTAAENASALPDAPQRSEDVRPTRIRLSAAAVLRRLATLELSAADRLERRAGTRLATG
jgi:hypothetical protein